jgi:peptidoglycan/LPS O-acetylase OafA/YrhL
MAAPAPIESLTGIRYLADAAVLMYHFVPADHSLGWLFRDGWLGVPFFFTLSGAVLAYSYLPTFLDGEGISWRRFLALRLVRIYPCYLLAFIIALVPFVQSQVRATASLEAAAVRIAGGAAMYLSLMQSWLTTPWTSGVVISPAWSLSCEWFFYVLFCPLLVLLRPLLKPGGMAVGLAFMATCISVVGFVVAEQFLTAHYPTGIRGFWNDYFWRGPFANFPYFLGGIFVGRLLHLSADRAGTPAAVATYAGIACLLLLFSGLGTEVSDTLKRTAVLPVSAAVILGLAAAHTTAARVLGTPVFSMLGEASYPLYLLQLPLNDVLASALPPPGIVGGAVRLVCFTVISVLVAILVERPTRRLLRDLLLGGAKKPASR